MHQTMSAVSLFTFSVPPTLPEGEPPLDPSIGFLPPNNGTTGQGFVSFTVRAHQQVPSLSTIDAKASIVFDQNEPIDTPPIFNTVSIIVYWAGIYALCMYCTSCLSLCTLNFIAS